MGGKDHIGLPLFDFGHNLFNRSRRKRRCHIVAGLARLENG